MGDDLAVRRDVLGLHSALRESTRDEQTPVAVERVLLRAHQGNAIFLGSVYHPFEAALELGGSSHALVIGDAVAVVFAALWATAELLPKEGIGNAVRVQLGFD